jgi:hypothetical protein
MFFMVIVDPASIETWEKEQGFKWLDQYDISQICPCNKNMEKKRK